MLLTFKNEVKNLVNVNIRHRLFYADLWSYMEAGQEEYHFHTQFIHSQVTMRILCVKSEDKIDFHCRELFFLVVVEQISSMIMRILTEYFTRCQIRQFVMDTKQQKAERFFVKFNFPIKLRLRMSLTL